MDYEDQPLNSQGTATGSGENFDVSTRPDGKIVINPVSGNVVILPADAMLDTLRAVGRDLEITLQDGQVIIIPEGVISVPQLVVDGVTIPALNVANLLVGNEPQPAAGETQSSGGNFAGDVGPIQDAFDLGDLLPYTELSFPQPEEEEIIPGLVDRDPVVSIEVGDSGTSVTDALDQVDESGLPERGVEPEGTASATNAEVTFGFINYDAPDGMDRVLVNGVEITEVGQTFTTDLGVLTITSIAPGRIGYDYVLTDNTLSSSNEDLFEVTVIDVDGDRADATLRIAIIDDAPIATEDTDIVPAGEFGPVSGNVLNNDVSGADDYPDGGEGVEAVTGFNNGDGSAAPGEALQGEYGVLTLHADGSYSYTRDFDTPGGVTDTFEYTIVDQDGSESTTTLTITIGNAGNTITLPEVGEGTAVSETGLPPRGDEPVGTGEIVDADPDNNSDTSETTTGVVTFNSRDGVASVTIDGTAIDPDNMPQTIVDNETGMLVITGYAYDPVTGDGSITYEYTLGDNTSGDDTTVEFDIVVTDLDGDSTLDDGVEDTLVISIVDDAPIALDNSASVDEGGIVTGDVLLDQNPDIPGADGFASSGAVIGIAHPGLTTSDDTADGSGDFVLAGEFGTLTLNQDGSYSYQANANSISGDDQDIFEYTIIDGDGDVSTAELVIDISNVEGEVFDDNVLVDESGLDGTGSQIVPNGEFNTDGQITAAGGTLPYTYVLTSPANGTYGTLALDPDTGAYSYELTSAFTDATGDDSRNTVNAAESFTYEVYDANSNLLGSGSIDVNIVDDVPELSVAGDTTVVEGQAATGTWSQEIGADQPGAVTEVIVNATSYAIDEAIVLAEGTLTVKSDFTWEFVSNTNLDHNLTQDVSFTVRVTDADNDVAEDTQAVDITDGPGPSGDGLKTITLDDETLPDGSNPGTTFASVDLEFGAFSDDLIDFAFDTDLSNLVGGLTWNRVSDTLIEGWDGPVDTGTKIVALELTAPASIAAGTVDDVTVTATLLDNYGSHPTFTADDLQDLGTIELFAFDQDGDWGNNIVSLKVSDDVPVAVNDSEVASEATGDLNIAFVLDSSGSIDNSELDQMLDAVQVAAAELFAGTTGDVTVTLVAFSHGSPSDGAITFGPFTSLADVEDQLDAINPAEGGTRPYGFATNYTAAIEEVMDNWTPDAGADNQVFFLSDGVPNRGLESGTNDTFPAATESAWNDFVSDNDIEVTAIGIGNGINLSRLQDVDVDGEGSPILVSDFGDVVDALLDSIPSDPVTGNVLTNDIEGADGARMLSVTVDGVIYTWDGSSSITPSDGGSAIAGSALTVDTALGGELSVEFSTGDYSYQPPAQVTSTTDEQFGYSIVDGDGDESSATLTVTVQDSSDVAPVVLDIDLQSSASIFSGLSENVAYDYNGDGVKTQTAWIAAGAAILTYDANHDGMVTDASEFVFGGDGVTDLQALAADYDSNSDGLLTADDSTYGKFGVWLDADLDGVSDEGEFVSLSDAGITSIELVSDGISYQAADGDVFVHGTASYTMEDGTVGTVADAAFMTGADVAAGMDALLALAAEGDDAELIDEAELAVVAEESLEENTIDDLLDQVLGEVENESTELASGEVSALLNSEIADTGSVNQAPITTQEIEVLEALVSMDG